MTRPRVALAGVHGYGSQHLERLLARQARGEVDLVGVADPRVGEVGTPPGTGRYTDLADLLADRGPDVVVVSTPLHTHAELATAALDAGAHVLLEKPPTSDTASFERLVAHADRVDRRCQVGFQSLGSDAVAHVRDRLAQGRIGEVRAFAAAACWVRTRSYYRRAPWAGRRSLDGRPVADGALTNPLSHAVATVLAVAGSQAPDDVVAVETDLWHAHDIEADDTSSARLTLACGRQVLVAVTLVAAERGEPYVEVVGTAGRLRLFYALDTVVEEVPGRPPLVTRHGRADLLDDLLAAVATGSPLASPHAAAGGFMRVLDAVMSGDGPRAVDPRFLRVTELPGGDEQLHLDRVEEAVGRAVREGALFGELDLPWAPAAR